MSATPSGSRLRRKNDSHGPRKSPRPLRVQLHILARPDEPAHDVLVRRAVLELGDPVVDFRRAGRAAEIGEVVVLYELPIVLLAARKTHRDARTALSGRKLGQPVIQAAAVGLATQN